jgi:hypothetical protein
MTRRWEYLTLVWTKRVEKKTKIEPGMRLRERPQEVEYWSYTETYYIWRPDEKKDEERPGMSTEVANSRSDTVGILNELGREGWEIIDRTVYRSTIGKALGWPKAGSPIEISWLMRRDATVPVSIPDQADD